jgi:hypothetical protein
MVRVESPAGRLVTFRVVPPVDDGNAARAALELRTAVVAIPGPVIVCADLTEARTFSASTTQQFVGLMKADNPKLERSALLLGDASPTFRMQTERMVREAGSPARRTFGDVDELYAWLSPVLTPEESAALARFLGRTATS